MAGEKLNEWVGRLPELEDGRRFPAVEREVAEEIYGELLAMDGGVKELVSGLTAVDDGGDWKVRFLIRGLVNFVGWCGAWRSEGEGGSGVGGRGGGPGEGGGAAGVFVGAGAVDFERGDVGESGGNVRGRGRDGGGCGGGGDRGDGWGGGEGGAACGLGEGGGGAAWGGGECFAAGGLREQSADQRWVQRQVVWVSGCEVTLRHRPNV